MITIYHNPRCKKSREGLAILEDLNIKFNIRKYLDETLNADELKTIIDVLKIKPEVLVRKNESIWKTNYKSKQLSHYTDTTREFFDIHGFENQHSLRDILITNIDKIFLISFGSVVILVISYFLVPTFYNKDLVKTKLVNQILEKYNLEVKFDEP